MSVNIISRPQISLTVPGVFTSKWWAVHNPIVYHFARRDWEIEFIVEAVAPNMLIRLVPGSLITVPIESYIGQSIYINSGQYNGTYTVINAYSVIGTHYFIISGYISDSFGGYGNDLYGRASWYLEVFVYKYNLTTHANDEITSLRFSGDVAGIIKANIVRALKDSVQALNQNDYSQVAYLDVNAFVIFHIGYREMWQGSVGFIFPDEIPDPNSPIDPSPFIPRRFFATNSVRQIQQYKGSNLAEYLSGVIPKGKFISDFVKPAYFEGYPFDIAYLFSDMSVFYLPNREIDKLDQTGSVVGHTSDLAVPTPVVELDGLQCPGEVRITIPGGYASDVKSIKLWLDSGDPFVSEYVDDEYVDDEYVEATEFVSPGVERITEQREIIINQECYDNPIYLAWRGSEGGWNYWLFGGDQKINLETSANGEFEKYIDDLETAEGKVEWINKKSQPSIQLGANAVDESNVTGMQGIMESVKVQMLVSLSPLKWQTVKVKPNSFSYTKRANKLDVDFVIDLPYRNTLSQ